MTIHTALEVLEQTSRTFYLPIIRLPNGLQEAVAAGYLCMRAIDEIEDHPHLPAAAKAELLQTICLLLDSQTSAERFDHARFSALFAPYTEQLPEVTLRLSEWACYAPAFIAPRVWEATSAMAGRMRDWVLNGFTVASQADLDRYTYSVAGAVGLLLCDLWAWFEHVQIHRSLAIQFGRALQSVNILRNRKEDLQRGVDFYPDDWGDAEMQNYARHNLNDFDAYMQSLAANTFSDFVNIPRALAHATLEALAEGREKLSRADVLKILQALEAQNSLGSA
ncbi:MAG: phytoene/squalene synthase family protein [Anaerolineales bacterium]|nr:phytoene/squalene synthase family protein [Anaerolineales bacterium]MBX3005162.1 phytoene/squalene synthase family protein [Anaerolineales bacterium]MCW5839214.1 phytoene/squalene synthase family protein [Anaerolineales bacterium]MCW5887899.1 phytoene/squalene synthase family protein [Anaerolineales bacterium]